MIDSLTPELEDAGKRAHEAIMLHITFGNWDDIKNQWLAISLVDGRCDNNLYASPEEAAKFQRGNENDFWYVTFRVLGPAGSKPHECEKMLMFYRDARDAGMKFVDPDHRVRMPLMTTGQHDYYQSVVRNSINAKVDAFLREIGH